MPSSIPSSPVNGTRLSPSPDSSPLPAPASPLSDTDAEADVESETETETPINTSSASTLRGDVDHGPQAISPSIPTPSRRRSAASRVQVQGHPRRPNPRPIARTNMRPSLMSATTENDEDEETGFSETDIQERLRLGREIASRDNSVCWVDWDRPTDSANPKHWSYRKKWRTTLVVSSFTFISPVASAMVAPATPEIAQEFGVTSTALTAMMTSVFVLGYAVGPLVLGPLSEIYGRSRVLQLSNLFFLAWNIGCSFAQNKNQLIGFRLMAGLGGSAPLSVGGGILGDMWAPEERGKAIAIYSLAPLLGPVIGPLCGGWIAEYSTWRWVFWSTSIVDAAVQGIGLVYLRETYAPLLLDWKAEEKRKTMDLEKGRRKEVKTVYEQGTNRSWKTIFKKALTRPFLLFYHEHIIQAMGLYMAFVYGIFYLFLTTIPLIFTEIYHERPGISGLNYIALGVGLTLTSQINARVLDRTYKYFKEKNGGVGQPEYRLPSLFPGTFLLPFGLFLAGWSAQNRLHWIATDVGIACIGSGMVLVFQAINTYVIDSFTIYSASALAAVSFLRSLAGFGFPLFAPAMYHKLGYGRGNTILACLSIGLGCPAPFLLWKYGKQIRMSSRYGRKSQAHQNAASFRIASRRSNTCNNDNNIAASAPVAPVSRSRSDTAGNR